MVKTGSSIVVRREGEKKGRGKINNLRNQEKQISEATSGSEVGMQIGGVKVEEGDVLEVC